ncbi:MAG: chromosomal protein MC1 [Proteobacteria bacterium]|nr:chromosomal protein MC1 [Pseudomonadota bacterium]
MSDSKKKYFVLRQTKDGPETDADGKHFGIFKSAQPRGAALKAATKRARDENKSTIPESEKFDIFLRERGTQRLHHFKGWVLEQAAPGDLTWNDGKKTKKFRQPHVKKQKPGVIRLDKK